MAVIRCQACGKPNPDFLEVCQYCDAPLRGGAPAATPAPEATAEQGTLRCQSCGKSNPDFLEVCQYCEARLKPLVAGAPASHDLPPSAPAAGDTLSRLRASAAPIEEEPEQEETAEPVEPATGDWMSRLRGDTGAPASEQPKDEPEWLWGGTGETDDEGRKTEDTPEAQTPLADETPDWLRSLGGATTEAQPETPAPAEDVPDWLRSMGSTEPEPPATPSAVPSDDVPDWLRSMGSTEPAAPSSAPAPSQAEPEFLWGASAAEPGTPAASEDVPDWLRSMGSAEPAPPAAPSAVPSEDTPDWLRSMGSAEPESPAAPSAVPSDNTPDWLRSMDSAEPEPPAAPSAVPSEDVPDWLRSMGSAEPTPAPAVIPPAASSEDVPDWLSTMGAESTPAPSTEPASTPFDEMPDWLRSMGSAETPPPEPVSPAFAPAPSQAEPEFLWGAPEPSATAEPEAPAPSEEMPDWLRSLGGETTSAPAESEAGPKVSPFAMPSGEMPDWLQTMAPDASAEPTVTSEAPDWLSGLRSSAAEAETSAPPDEELAPGEMPAWLGSMAAGAATIPQTGPLPETPESPQSQPARSIFGGPTTPSKGNLAQGALPSWLTAMRPVDVGQSAIEPEMDNYEETVGFLAGVPGILRAEPTVALPRKSTLNVHKLEVSPAQAERASLLTRLLESDTEARPASKRGLQIALPFERWIVFLVIALAVFVPAFVLPDIFSPPQTMSQETLDAFLTLNSLPTDKPVLVAFDYEPAQTGELNRVAEALLMHLMRRGVPLVGVSTRLGGAAVGDTLLKQLSVQPQLIQQIGYTYTYGINYTHLGYIPGGAVGVLKFTDQPRLVFNADFSGDAEVWTKQAIVSQVESFSDFGLVLIIAATPDSARTWIEQVHSYSASTQLPMPMIAAVSAGAEPMVLPYYEGNPQTRQIQGLVSGVLAAAQYERQAGASGAANQLWGALGGGLLTAALLLIVGNLMYGIIGFIRRRRAA